MRMLTTGILMSLVAPLQAGGTCSDDGRRDACVRLDPITIVGARRDVGDVAGGASVIGAEELEQFEYTDVVRALRRVPGLALQQEDGYGLRPNIGIRGTPTERSSRVTLLEDNVLIAPAPYAAPAAYYFPTFGRIHSLEVLKGPASITQGPYTIGGAVNLLSTPLPAERGGFAGLEAGSDATWRAHAWYGDATERTGWLVETHQWRSDGYQEIDRSNRDTGLDKADYMAKFSLFSAPDAAIQQQLDVKLQTSSEESEQSYLGLTDADFRADPLRRYGLSALDVMDNEHEQAVATWRIAPSVNTELSVTAYENRFERAWYKTEGIDFDGTMDPGDWSGTSWSNVVQAINLGASLGGVSAHAMQAILDGADTEAGALRLRNNSREYESRGVQAVLALALPGGRADHELEFGLRWHEDSEDRLQRDDTWQQLDGQLVLSARGAEGGAGNRLQEADAWAAFVRDRIEFDRLVLTPGIRLESIEQTRTDYGGADPAGREPGDVTRVRRNREDVLIPGIGALYALNGHWSLVGGVHKGFSAPGNQDGVDPEESVNWEAGARFAADALAFEAIAFYNDYENLQGVCTASSGTGCEIGDVFNGDAVTIPGLEFSLQAELARGQAWSMPLTVSYTWMDAEFENDIDDSEFFGDVRAGDPVPYVPDHQAFVSVGFEQGPWAAYLSGQYTDAVCTVASCGPFEKTDASTVFDLGLHWQLRPTLQLYTVLENLTDAADIVGRQPYGARPGKARSWLVGARFTF